MSSSAVNKVFSFALLLAVLCSGPVFGQAHKAAKKGTSNKKVLRVRRVNTLGPRFLEETPQYNSNASRGVSDPKKWQVITIPYETAPEWIDELTVQFYALAFTRDQDSGKKIFSLYKLTVKYSDIERGRSHKATAFLRPTAIKRYGNVFAVAAVFTVGGKVVAEVSQETERLPEKWWKNPRVVERQDVVVRTGYLLNRAQSPWAMINYDDYEVIK